MQASRSIFLSFLLSCYFSDALAQHANQQVLSLHGPAQFDRRTEKQGLQSVRGWCLAAARIYGKRPIFNQYIAILDALRLCQNPPEVVRNLR